MDRFGRLVADLAPHLQQLAESSTANDDDEGFDDGGPPPLLNFEGDDEEEVVPLVQTEEGVFEEAANTVGRWAPAPHRPRPRGSCRR